MMPSSQVSKQVDNFMFDGHLTSPTNPLPTNIKGLRNRKNSIKLKKKMRRPIDQYDATEVQTYYPTQMISEMRLARQKI